MADDLRYRIGGDTTGFNAAMATIERRAAATGRVMDTALGNSVKGFIGGGVAGITASFTAALAPMALFAKGMNDIAETAGLQRLADRIGMSTTSLQSLQFAAVQAGVDIDQMGDGLGDFAAKVAEASAGAGPLAEIFKANGVELKKQDGTLRSTRDILGDFANLIQNARTPAEQLFLAQQAFGDEAAKMVPIFKNGARGLQQLEVNAKAAGAVIDESLIKRADELDKRMQSMWTTFSARSKSATLAAIEGLDSLLTRLDDYERRRAAAEAGTRIGGMVTPAGQAITTGKSDKPSGLEARMAGAVSEALSKTDQRLVDALKARYEVSAQKATIIPSSDKGDGGKGSSRSRSIKAIREERDAAAELIEALEFERSLISMTDAEREVANNLRHAGAEATAEQRARIEELTKQILEEEMAADRLADAYEQLGDIGVGAVNDLANALSDGKLEADELLGIVMNLVQQLLTMPSGGLGSILGGLFGGGGAGGGISWADDIFRAKGGPVQAGKAYIVGEKGPEPFIPESNGTILPNSALGGSTMVNFAPVMDLRGTQPGVGEEVKAAMREIMRDFTPNVLKSLREIKMKGMA